MTTITPPAPVEPVRANVARLPSIENADDFSTPEGLAAWAVKNAVAAVPVLIWQAFVKAQREKRQQLEAELAECRARLNALEARPAAGVEYGGVYETGKAYTCGRLVTKKGGLWLSLRDTTQSPGMDPLSWKLVVKEGQAR